MLPSRSPAIGNPHLIPDRPPCRLTDLHPISGAVRKNEIGKGLMNLAVTMAVAIAYEQKMKKGADCIVVGLMVALMFIGNGILLRTNFDRLANLVELIGIKLFVISVFGFVAISLSNLWASVILGICCVLCLLPLLVSLKHSADFVNGGGGDVGGGGAVFEGGECGGRDGGGLVAVQVVDLELKEAETKQSRTVASQCFPSGSCRLIVLL